ncbi:hypothetical protein Enr10x_08080 [Gimesia panareensis]|uniref:Uncharacterized protein n=1 Tax=Gimesia panareensis TaxID=2527978 RepID=A0A517Q1R1_9PLAN|nr:hypothetical protein [Gimesia panareensis]QDT25512.1 hypothetical protein Enr10x_08080 [Gimesia panareensis]
MTKTNPLFSYANLSGFVTAICQPALLLLYITVREIHPDQDMMKLAVVGPLLSLSLMGAVLILLRQAGTGSVKAVLTLNEILIALLINGIVWFCLFYSLIFMGLGLTILNPFLGWLSTLQDGLVLVALFAGFSAYVAELASLALIYPFLFSMSLNEISTFELK